LAGANNLAGTKNWCPDKKIIWREQRIGAPTKTMLARIHTKSMIKIEIYVEKNYFGGNTYYKNNNN
jgi:hypothetical protein